MGGGSGGFLEGEVDAPSVEGPVYFVKVELGAGFDVEEDEDLDVLDELVDSWVEQAAGPNLEVPASLGVFVDEFSWRFPVLCVFSML